MDANSWSIVSLVIAVIGGAWILRGKMGSVETKIIKSNADLMVEVKTSIVKSKFYVDREIVKAVEPIKKDVDWIKGKLDIKGN